MPDVDLITREVIQNALASAAAEMALALYPTAHHLDLGGRLPGSSACDNTEIFQDGFRIPWLKLYRKGEPDESLFALLQANVRVPHMTLGDVRAQLAACHIGERAVHDLVARYGVAYFLTCA